VWSHRVDRPEPRANVWRIVERLQPLMEELRSRLNGGADANDRDLTLYEDAVLHLLYTRYYPKFLEAPSSPQRLRWRFYADFRTDWRHFLEIDGVRFPGGLEARHAFACFRQIQRAFERVFLDIIGGSMPAARLRAAVWQSIFTHDMRRYRRT